MLAVELDGREVIFDPMSNRWFDHPLDAILARPELATAPDVPDARSRERGYELYSTAEWYRRVRRTMRREDLERPGRWIDRGRS